MATITALEDIQIEGTNHIYLLTIAMDSSYPTGGEALDLAANRTIKFMSVPPKAGYVFSWDQDNQKLLAYRTKDPGNAGGADIVLQEVANTTDALGADGRAGLRHRFLTVFARIACWLCGHQWSWTYAVSVGITDAAVCRHCKRVYRA